MASQTYRGCEAILKYLVEKGFTYQVSQQFLKEAIIMLRGGDPRTVTNWMKNLHILGFIERVNLSVYKMNLAKCPEALEKVIKEKGQKKLL